MKQRDSSFGSQRTGMRRNNTLNANSTLGKKAVLKQPDRKENLCSNSVKLTAGTTSLKKRAKAGSTRLLGDRKEALVSHSFEKAKLLVEETQNSGATNFDGDMLISTIKPDYIRSEVKYRNTDGFTVVKEHWEDIKRKALTHGGTPALITVNKSDEKLITMSVDDLALLLQKAIELCKTQPGG